MTENMNIEKTDNKIEWKTMLLQTVKMFFVFAVLLGLIYPLFITAIANITMKDKATGSFVKVNEITVGSSRIGQKFVSDKYFKTRPSAVNYDAAASGASNLGPTSKKLKVITQYRAEKAKKIYGIKNGTPLPPDMVTASSSGLDPNISLENAYLQAKKVAKAKNMPESHIKKLIKENIDPDFIGIWGENSVNVLKLNIALDMAAFASVNEVARKNTAQNKATSNVISDGVKGK